MTASLLEKEKEFVKMNAELEIRTKALMHEVDSVMKMQNVLAAEAKIQTARPLKSHELANGDGWQSYEENNIPSGTSVLTKCLKTRIALLQNELESVKAEYKTKCNEVKHINLECGKIEEERNKFQLLSQTYKEQKEKLQQQISGLNSRIQTKDIELISMRKENESLKKELKTINMNIASNESKLNKLQVENEKSKTNLLNAKQEEKELRESYRKQINDLTCQNKRLEKQVAELTNGFRKQMLLVDNLKKQKMYLESAKLVQISQEEFSKILDWKPAEVK